LFGSDTRSLRLFDEQTQFVNQLTQSLNPLLTEMEMLQGKTSLSATEQERLRDVMQQIASLTPSAVSKWDQYGNAIEVSTNKAQAFLALQKEIRLERNRDAIQGLRSSVSSLEKKNVSDLSYLNAGGKNHVLRNSSVFKAFSPEELNDLSSNIRSRNIKIADALQQMQQLGVTLSDQENKFLQALNVQFGGNPMANNGDDDPEGNGSKPKGSSGIDTIIGTGVQQKSLTVHIQNLNEGGIHVNTKNVQESPIDIKELFTEMLVEAVRNFEETQ
jgi:hypothetical protein